ncbi:hypothetical protein Ais01nite_01780 [Asanoa ishikariensis]|uniref:Uncharacterized protein n=1 Tax=Asanoa ishikariensis TaxID=137265 RepID=A0A1H3TNW9_9ACTN|nr:hypothetical protein [Asanoa ishikariensis]GIF62143.1 hypothetical protein Ais01nite_01780 [Asanoa ishikariensis]SDZ51335.1 hypothetical protein SAMN05421684_6044 [Asanoa ishikariensis]
MAIVFELVVNFGSDDAAARAACDLVRGAAGIKVGSRHIRLHEPLLNRVTAIDGVPYLEMSVMPVGVGAAVALDRGHERLRLTAAELSIVGRGLYELVAGLAGYQAAKVGWEPDWQVDPAELRQNWADVLADGDDTLAGLVLAETVLADLRGPSFVPFAAGFLWIPYDGERPSALTADQVQ